MKKAEFNRPPLLMLRAQERSKVIHLWDESEAKTPREKESPTTLCGRESKDMHLVIEWDESNILNQHGLLATISTSWAIMARVCANCLRRRNRVYRPLEVISKGQT